MHALPFPVYRHSLPQSPSFLGHVVRKRGVGYKLSRVALETRMVYRQTDFTPKRVVVSRLHDTVARFHTGMKFLPRYNNRGELMPG